MSDFTAEWLALREPADHRARSPRVSHAMVEALRGRAFVRAVDLASGTGSNVRFLSPLLTARQEWLLLDRDAALLERAQRIPGIEVHTRMADLTQPGEMGDAFAARDLITTSALLDLVSDEWLADLCTVCRDHRAAVLFALSYDGRIVCSPSDPEDVRVRGLVNRHQHTDKGFGPALGPDAADRAASHLEMRGYQVVRDRSDWLLEPESVELQRQLIEGWAGAAEAVSPADARVIAAWRERRLAHVDQRRSRLVVGHEDLAAFIA